MPSDLPTWLPYVGTALGGGGVFAIAKPMLEFLTRNRKQTDDVLERLVATLQARVAELEAIVRSLQHELRNATTEADGMFWLLKYAPEDRRTEAVADVEQRRRERLDRKGEARQAAQIELSAHRMIPDIDG